MLLIMLITNARLITHDALIAPGWLLLHGDKIAHYGAGMPPPISDERLDARDAWLLPGMIDVHVHGAVGCETMDADPAALNAMSRCYAEHGVTSFLATTWTDNRQRIQAALEVIADMQGKTEGAALLGAHLEGPYLNPARCGAQDSRVIRRADRAEATAFLDLGVIRLLALAPEYAENEWLIEVCAARGIAVSAAHTDATYEQMSRAVALGVRQTTHTYNAMRPLHHREPGTVGAALTMDALMCELIADGVHVHPAMMGLLWRAKGADGVLLVSDAVRGAGLPQGATYLQDGREVVVRDAAYLGDGALAGSTTLLDASFANFIRATGAAITDAWKVVSLNPARALGIDAQKGSIAYGKDADLVLLDDDLRVQMTIVAGRIVYNRNE
jgi:N-acetylglucosamine-6-phosphate deacetylase